MPLILSFSRRERGRRGDALACRRSRGAEKAAEALDEGPFSPREKDRMRGATASRPSARPVAGAGYRAVRFRNRELPGGTEGVLQRLLDEPSPELGEEQIFLEALRMAGLQE